MIIERFSFQAKYGQGDALIELVREFNKTATAQGLPAISKVYVDRTGPMFSVSWDEEHNDMNALAQMDGRAGEMFSNPEFQAWFAKMTPLVERGERQLLQTIEL